MSLSKEEKRNLKKGYRDALKNEVTELCVISESLRPDNLVSKLISEFQKIKLNPLVSCIDESKHEYVVAQRANSEHYVHIAIRQADHELISLLEPLEQLTDTDLDSLHGFGVAILTSQARLSEVNDLLLTATLRVFGRLFQGHYANSHSIMDDWLAWSLDYSGPTMAEVTRLYDDECPDFKSVLKAHQDLVYKKPWWKLRKPRKPQTKQIYTNIVE